MSRTDIFIASLEIALAVTPLFHGTISATWTSSDLFEEPWLETVDAPMGLSDKQSGSLFFPKVEGDFDYKDITVTDEGSPPASSRTCLIIPARERQQGCPSTCWILSQRNESQILGLSEGSSKRLILNR